jgi:hypothetical protein
MTVRHLDDLAPGGNGLHPKRPALHPSKGGLHVARLTKVMTMNPLTPMCRWMLTLCVTACLGLNQGLAAAARPQARALSATEQSELIDRIAERLQAQYHDPARVEAALAALRAQPLASSWPQLARRWTVVLQQSLADAHARLIFSAEPLPPEPTQAACQEPAQDAGPPEPLVHYMNCGVERVGHHVGNVGYLRLAGMPPTAPCQATLAAALQVLSHSDAIILDLRSNRGGSPQSVQWLASHFLPPGTPLSRMVSVREGVDEPMLTLAGLPGPHLPDVPLYVLTSPRTFSAGEHLAYDLQQARRALVVGERSGGGANPGAFRTVHPHLRLWVSLARSVSPVTGGNWEGAGVQPDLAVRADVAACSAYGRALKDLVPRPTLKAMEGERQELLARLDVACKRQGL